MAVKFSAPLASLIPKRQAAEASRAMARAGGVALRAAVKANTPVAHGWDTGGLSQDEITLLRGGRRPGTLRESIYMLPPLMIGGFGMQVWRTVVATDDPIAPYVEWDTRPHMIYPRNASVLRWFDIKSGGNQVFAMAVAHPGTHGQHMFTIGAALVEVSAHAILQPIADAWAAADFAAMEESMAAEDLAMVA